jgi:uridine phosphorylase
MDTTREHILIHPRRGKGEAMLPARAVLLVNPLEAEAVHATLLGSGGQKRFLFNSSLSIAKGGCYCVAGPAIGAPMAVLVMEKLVVLGVKELVLCGWCGGIDTTLQIGDVIIPERAEAGEGTSRYYPVAPPLAPDKDFSRQLRAWFVENGMEPATGCIWSTDAIFREDQRQLRKLHQQAGVVAVDMEFSALCAVAAFRGLTFGAALVVSDILHRESWNPGFRDANFIANRQKSISHVLNFLMRKSDSW